MKKPMRIVRLAKWGAYRLGRAARRSNIAWKRTLEDAISLALFAAGAAIFWWIICRATDYHFC